MPRENVKCIYFFVRDKKRNKLLSQENNIYFIFNLQNVIKKKTFRNFPKINVFQKKYFMQKHTIVWITNHRHHFHSAPEFQKKVI